MRALVVHCHPVEGSFSSALRDAAIRGLSAAGHHVDLVDLGARGFDPVMKTPEWESYVAMSGSIPDELADDVALVREAGIIVFVYPTWWSAAPAQLKGWVERVFMPTVAFSLDERNRVSPSLGNLRRIATVTTFGSPRAYTVLMNDNGSRLLRRTLRLVAVHRVRTVRLALFRMDRSTEQSRRRFVARVEKRMARL